MGQAAVGLICLIISVGTFLLEGKQWPTFITAGIGGIILGHVSTTIAGKVYDATHSVFSTVGGWIS